MGWLRTAVRFAWILLGAASDALLFPFRLFLFWIRGRSFQKRALADLAQSFAPEQEAASSPLTPAIRRVFLGVGDISAEPHALRLMEAMRKRNPSIEWIGFGGRRMEAAGCRVLFNPVDLALFGFSGPAKQIPKHLGALWRFLKLIETDPPDLVVLLDYPGFHLYLAKAAKGKVPVAYYICPQIWAWAPWRLRSFRRSVDLAISILPFETAFFRRHGLEASYVGHPIADTLAASDELLAAKPASHKSILAILPGSRSSEIALNLPAMLRVAERMRRENPAIQCVIPHDREDRIEQVRAIANRANFPVEVRAGRLHETLRESRLALVKSGTAILEVGHFDLPMVVFYKFPPGFAGRWRDWARRRLLITPWFASLNLLANREIIPEFAYGNENMEEKISQSALSLWKDGPERDRCLADLRAVRGVYDVPGTADRAASALLPYRSGNSPR